MTRHATPDHENVQRFQAEIEAITGRCTCIDGYSDRGLVDPRCVWHECGEDVAKLCAENALLDANLKWLRARYSNLREAALDLIPQIVFNHPGATGMTTLLDHEPLYRLALLVHSRCITKDGEERVAKEDA